MNKILKLVTCLKCGLVWMGVTRIHAEKEVESFNKFFKTLSKKEQKDCYGGKRVSIESYENCGCGSNDFRPYKKGDCPDNCTLNPVIYEPRPNFPGTIKSDENGVIEFRPVQWKWFIKNFGIKAKTLTGQKKAIKKIVTDAIMTGIKKS